MKKRVFFDKVEEDRIHYKNLKAAVNEKLNEIPKSRKFWAKFKAIVLPVFYIVFYVLAIRNWESTPLYMSFFFLMGLTNILLFLNLIHDAAHNAVFDRRWLNQAFMYVFDITGANSFIWKKRHVLSHHRFQNIAGWDSDVQQGALFKIYPHDEKTKFHKYQHHFILLIYPLYLINWVFIRDFKDFFVKSDIIKNMIKIPPIEYVKLILFKLFFIYYTVIFPIHIGVSPEIAIGTLFFMLITSGSISLLILLTPHVNSANYFPYPDEKGNLPISWLEHQFITTNDLTLDTWFSRNILSNFNYHIAHHLFPSVPSSETKEVTEVIRDFAKENNFRYRSFKPFTALRMHYDLIKNNAEDKVQFNEVL